MMDVDWIQLARDGNERRAVTKEGRPVEWPSVEIRIILKWVSKWWMWTGFNWLVMEMNDELLRKWKQTAWSAQQPSGYRQELLSVANLTECYASNISYSAQHLPSSSREILRSVECRSWRHDSNISSFARKRESFRALWHSLSLLLGLQHSLKPPSPHGNITVYHAV